MLSISDKALLDNLSSPYFVETEIAGLDFNREIVNPGTNTDFPEGAYGIRVDDDFWTAAVLPYSLIHIPLEEVVGYLWPQYKDEATFCPDHGTVEQRIYFLELSNDSLTSTNKHLNKLLRDTQSELQRLKEIRPPLHQHHQSRHKAESDYFIRQYEHLLVAMAHEATPFLDKKGVCSKCGLLISDRLHDQHYIDLKKAGYQLTTKHLLEY